MCFVRELVVCVLTIGTFVGRSCAQVRKDNDTKWTDGSVSTFRKDELYSASNNVSLLSPCSKDIYKVVHCLLEGSKSLDKCQWALQFLDAQGKPPSDLMGGYVFWPGSRRECLAVKAPDNKFHTKYCTVKVNVSLEHSKLIPKIDFHGGLCLPTTCSPEELESDLNDVIKVLHILHILPKLPKGTTVKIEGVNCETPVKFSKSAQILCIVLVSLVVVVAVGTVADVYKIKLSITCQRTLVNQELGDSDSNHNLVVREEQEAASVNKAFVYLFAFLSCFSIKTNYAKFTELRQENELGFLDGIRVISMVFAIGVHCFILAIPFYGNLLEVVQDLDNLLYYIFIKSALVLDVFYVLSGLLISYLYFAATPTKGFSTYILFWLHKLWKILPSYAIVIWMSAAILPLLARGPYSHYDAVLTAESVKCSKSWWKNLLFINNFEKFENNCINWSWELANYVQLVLLCPLLLVLLKWKAWVGTLFGGIIVVLSWSVVGLTSYKHDLITFGGIAQVVGDENIPRIIRQVSDYVNLLYIRPFCHIGPFILGILFGHAANNRNKGGTRLGIINVALETVLSISVLFLAFYVTYRRDLNRLQISVVNALTRTVCAYAVAWLMFLCVTGRAIWIRNFLNRDFWTRLGKLTFGALLLHPLVIAFYLKQLQAPIIFTHVNMIVLSTGVVVLSYLLAFVLALLVELPFKAVENFLQTLLL